MDIVATEETKIGSVSLMENGIIRIFGNSDIHIELEDMYENDRVFVKLTKRKPAPFLVIFGNNTSISPEAIDYFSYPGRPQLKIAEALVTPQLHHKIIVRQLHTIGTIKYPVAHFANETFAIEWLLQFCE